jgi:hypothetical protein
MLKKKLYVLIKGGLGNQLFIYTAAQSLAKKNNINQIFYINTGDVLVGSDFQSKKIQDIDYYIKNIKIKKDFLNNKYLNFLYVFFKYKLFNKVITDRNILNSKINFFNRGITIDGFFQNKKIFYDQLENTIDKIYLNRIKNNIKNNNLVISLSLYCQFGFTIPIDFYLNAMKKLRIKKNEKIIITTDDEWYGKLFLTYLKTYGFTKIVINFNKNKTAFDDFSTIANSEKLIMSTSTFCWWAAVIRKKIGHKDQNVVCPKVWLSDKNKKLFKTVDLRIKNNWIYL